MISLIPAPKNYRFSPLLTITALIVAVGSFTASSWQWDRYLYKLELVETYEEHSTSKPLELPKGPDFKSVIHKKVKLSGVWDYERETYVINRPHKSGAGYWLLTPLKLPDREKHIIVSRGFIPFGEDTPEEWEKYHEGPDADFEAVVQASIPPRTLLSPTNATPEKGGKFLRKWLYPDLDRMQLQFPYPLETAIFVQKIGGPASGEFPAESISIRVPPSTHYWYSYEWIMIGVAAILISAWLQLYPRGAKQRMSGKVAVHKEQSYN